MGRDEETEGWREGEGERERGRVGDERGVKVKLPGKRRRSESKRNGEKGAEKKLDRPNMCDA